VHFLAELACRRAASKSGQGRPPDHPWRSPTPSAMGPTIFNLLAPRIHRPSIASDRVCTLVPSARPYVLSVDGVRFRDGRPPHERERRRRPQAAGAAAGRSAGGADAQGDGQSSAFTQQVRARLAIPITTAHGPGQRGGRAANHACACADQHHPPHTHTAPPRPPAPSGSRPPTRRPSCPRASACSAACWPAMPATT
jgi:hypothetical protein